MGTYFLVPTEIRGPDGYDYMLPGNPNWTDTWIAPDGEEYVRDISDVFRYWLCYYRDRTFVGFGGGPVPMSGVSAADPNIIQFRSGVGTYWMEYGLKLGAEQGQVNGLPGVNGIEAWMHRADGTPVPNFAGFGAVWPDPPSYSVVNLVFETDNPSAAPNLWAKIAQGNNQAEEQVVIDMPGVLTAGSNIITNCTIPTLDSVGHPVIVPDMIGDRIRCNIPTYDPGAPGDGGGWVFDGDVDPAAPGVITNVVAVYPSRPLSTDWIGRHVRSNPLVFAPRPPGARISDVAGTTVSVIREDTFAPFPIAVPAGRYRFWHDNDRSFPLDTIILSIDPPSPGAGRTVVVSHPSNFSWGIAGPVAPVQRPGAILEPRRRNGVQLISFDNFTANVTIRKLWCQMGNPPGNAGVFTPHESWHMFAYRTCANIEVDVYGRNAWGDMHNFTSLPTDIRIRGDYDYCGRHMWTAQGYAGVDIAGRFDHPKRWYLDCESITLARMIDMTLHDVDLHDAGLGFMKWEPGVDSLPAPAVLNGVTMQAGTPVVSFASHSAEYPINRRDVTSVIKHMTGENPVLHSGPLTYQNLGQNVDGPGIADGTYITRIGWLGVSATLSDAPTAPMTNGTLTLGETAQVRGLTLQRVHHHQKCLEIWWRQGNCRGDMWVRGRTVAGSPVIDQLYFPARPDGSRTPNFFDVLPVDGTPPPRFFCIFNDVFPGPRRVNLNSGDWIANYLIANVAALLSGTWWFYFEGNASWQGDDVLVEDCIGEGLWAGQHTDDVATNKPLIQLPHKCSRVTIRRNRQPARVGANGIPKEIIVGTTNPKDYPSNLAEYNAGMRAYPRAVSQPATPPHGHPPMGPPWNTPFDPNTQIGNPAWDISENYFPGAIDNQITDTRGTWMHTLEASGITPGLVRAGSVTPAFPFPIIVTPLYEMATNDDVILTAGITTTDFIGGVEGEIHFLVFHAYGFLAWSGIAPIVNDVATVTIPADTFPTGYYLIVNANYPGFLDTQTGIAYEATSFRSIVFGPGYPGWQAIDLSVGAPIVATDTTLILDVTPNPATYRQTVTLTASVTGETPGHPPTGLLEIDWDPTTILATGPTPSLEHSRRFTPGIYTIVARFTPDQDDVWNRPAEVTVELEVTPGPALAPALGQVRM